MKDTINNNLEQLRKSVWMLTKDALENIKMTLEKLDVSALQKLQQKVDEIISLPLAVAENEQNISNLQDTKVDKVEGKQLSSNDFTNEEKIKLASLEVGGGEVEIPEGIVIDANYVHSDNNYTTSEKEKLAGIEAGANKTVLPSNLVVDANYVHTDNNYTTTDREKLATIERGATKTVLPENLVTDSKYTHTDNNYTTADRDKLAGIEEGATKTVIPLDIVLDANYNHTDCNFTAAEKNKLANIETEANKYVLPSYVALKTDIVTNLSRMNEDETHRLVTDTEKTAWNAKANDADLAAVAKSGAYSDLSGVPVTAMSFDGATLLITIPVATTEPEE